MTALSRHLASTLKLQINPKASSPQPRIHAQAHAEETWLMEGVLYITRRPLESEFNQFFMKSPREKLFMHSSVIASTSKEAMANI